MVRVVMGQQRRILGQDGESSWQRAGLGWRRLWFSLWCVRGWCDSMDGEKKEMERSGAVHRRRIR
jgi:hypothetical protein